jgi:recombination protein RecA
MPATQSIKSHRSTAKTNQSARAKVVDEAIARIDKMFGRGALMRMDDASALGDIPTISTGCLSLDLALGVGGIPRGRVTEIYGPESSGKTTLTLHLIAEAQKAGGVAAFIDAEHALDVKYASQLGVDVPSLLVSQPDSGEQALEITDILVRSGAVDLVVIDSVAALTPKSEIEGDMGDHHVGLQARLMSQALRKLTAVAARSGTAVVFINQLRMKIGVMFGSPETTTGGQALKFYSSIRIDIRRIGSIKQGDQVLANRARIKVVKNKVAPPFRQTEVEIHFGRGICSQADMIEQALNLGCIQKSGSWLTWGDIRVQGREALRQRLIDTPSESAQLKHQLLSVLGLGESTTVAEG